jgi:hypothetical protein
MYMPSSCHLNKLHTHKPPPVNNKPTSTITQSTPFTVIYAAHFGLGFTMVSSDLFVIVMIDLLTFFWTIRLPILVQAHTRHRPCCLDKV